MDKSNYSYRKAKKVIEFFTKEEKRSYTIKDEHKYRFGKTILNLPTPNNTGIFLSVSDKELASALEIWNSLLRPALSSKSELKFDDNEIALYYEYLTHIQMAIISLFTAFENFANSLIPYDFLFVEECNGGTIVMDKPYIERNKSIEFKLSVILVEALKISSPKQSKNWSAFKKLILFRNEIIHMKTDSLAISDHEKNLYYTLIASSIFKTLKSAKALLCEIMDQVIDSWEVPIIEEESSILKIVFSDLDTAVEYFQNKGVLSRDNEKEAGGVDSPHKNEFKQKSDRIERFNTITRIK